MSESKLHQYLLEVEKTFKFKIKTLFPLKDDVLDLLEKALKKYNLISISKPEKTMFQTNPLGFTGVKSAEVYIVDIEVTVPVTQLVLQYDLRDILGIHKDSEELKVFGELQTELESDVPQSNENQSLLVNDNYEEIKDKNFDDYFGEKYNERFLKMIKEKQRELDEKTGRGKKINAKNPLTSWDDLDNTK